LKDNLDIEDIGHRASEICMGSCPQLFLFGFVAPCIPEDIPHEVGNFAGQ
jgi:hypothetical protein